MARGKKHTAEQIVNLLRQVEVSVANGKDVAAGVQGSGGLWSRRTTAGVRSLAG